MIEIIVVKKSPFNNQKTYVYVDENGKKSKEYLSLQPFSEGFGCAVTLDNMRVYVDENFNESEKYLNATIYENGVAAVRCLDGKYRYRDKSGKLSEDFYEYAGLFYDGLSEVLIVGEDGEPKWHYRDINGNLSEGYSKSINSYSQGYAVVEKSEDGKNYYYFRDLQGNLSEKFDWALSYQNDFAVVREVGSTRYKYRDLQGNLSSESYYDAGDYGSPYDDSDYIECSDEFSIVYPNEDSEPLFRDVLGNLSTEETTLGVDAHNYIKGYSKIEDLNPESLCNERLLRVILSTEKSAYEKAVSMEGGKERKNEIKSNYEMLMNGLAKSVQFGLFPELKDCLSSNTYKNSNYVVNSINSKSETPGQEFIDYITDKKTVFELSDICFASDAFLKSIMTHEQIMFEQAMGHCKTNNDMKKLIELVDFVAEYIKDKAYDEYLRKQNKTVQKEQNKQNERKRLKTQLEQKVQNMF